MLGGFDILAAKICSFAIGVGLIMPLVLVRDKMQGDLFSVVFHVRLTLASPISTIVLTIIYEILLIGFWFINHGWVS